jgi:hypothetical protein
VSELVGNGLALTLLIFGVMALYAYLANSSVRALALGAMVLSIFGIALQLTGLVYHLTSRFEEIVERDVREGQHRNPSGRPEWFTTAYFHLRVYLTLQSLGARDWTSSRSRDGGYALPKGIEVEGEGNEIGAA